MTCIMFLVLMGYLMVPGVLKAASGGRIDLYADAGLSECSLADTEPQVADVYVVHRIWGFPVVVDGAVGIQFRLASSEGFTGTWLEDILPPGMAAVGTSPSGIGVSYRSCLRSDVLVLHARYQMQGTSSSCSFVETVPYPNLYAILTSTCGSDPRPVDGEHLYVNPDESCPCDVPPVATESSTWGRIKAMYRD